MNITELRERIKNMDMEIDDVKVEDLDIQFLFEGEAIFLLDRENDINFYRPDYYVDYKIFDIMKPFIETDIYKRLEESSLNINNQKWSKKELKKLKKALDNV